MLYGRIGEKNFVGIVENIARFCEVESTTALGHRDAAYLRISCDAQNRQIYDIDVSMYIGDRLSSGKVATIEPVEATDTQTVLTMLGKRVGLDTKEKLRARKLVVKHSDYVGFSGDNTVLLFTDYSGSKLELYIKLRLRDIYTLRLNNITERVANCLLDISEAVSTRIDKKWSWTKKLICMASLEVLLRNLNLWDIEAIRDECRNEAVIKLMLSDLLFDGIEGLDEYNMYSNDAKQRVLDSELLLRCGQWLIEGGQDVASGLRATDIPEKALVGWKKTLEDELGVVLPALNKQGELRRPRPQKASILAV